MAAREPMSLARRMLIVVAGLSIGIMLVGGWPKSDPSGRSEAAADQPRKPGEGDVATMAKGTCRIAVPQALNDPGSVEFEPSDTWTVKLGTDHRHVVHMGLRAKNAFNATIYAEFDCLVEDRGTEWEAISAVQTTP
mgnify:FL=1